MPSSTPPAPSAAAVKGRVLAIAGSDSGGGAGIEADVKTVTALGGYAMTAITALTAQDTRGVHAVIATEPAFVARQIALVLDDIGADAVKTGMLVDAAMIDAVAAALAARALPLVVDPVMAATGGARLLAENAIDSLRQRLFPLATLVTPNIPEAEALAGLSIASRADMAAAARRLLALGCRAVLLKGGHLEGSTVVDLLASANGIEAFENPRLASKHTHGTGCTLASAIATGLAQGQTLSAAVARARAYLQEAIRTAPGFGHGRGPLNHAHTVRPFDVQ